MEKTLSSGFTFFFKIVTPVLQIGVGIVLLVVLSLTSIARGRGGAILLCCLWLFVQIVLNYYNNFRLKVVNIDGDYLRISNYLKKTTIPLSEVEKVEKSGGYSWWRWPPVRVVIFLRGPSEFGDRIMFIPGYLASQVVEDLTTAKSRKVG